MSDQTLSKMFDYFLFIYAPLLLIFLIWFFWRRTPLTARRVKSRAKMIAEMKWYVKGLGVFPDTVILDIATYGRRRDRLIIPFRKNHPSAVQLEKLRHLELIEFDFVDKPLDCALDSDVCAYLQLRVN